MKTTSIAQPAVSAQRLSGRQWWVVIVSSLGQMIGTTVATIAGIIIPLYNIVSHPELSASMQGLIGAADLIGICIGSVIFGRLSDRYGYLLFFRLCPALMLVAAVVAALIPSIAVLTVALFVIGLGIGGEYSLDSGYVSELMPSSRRALMVGVTKSACALGNVLAAGLGLAIIMGYEDANLWPGLMWIVAGVALLMLLLRIRFYESPMWLMAHGDRDKAVAALHDFLGPNADVSEYLETEAPAKQIDNKTDSAPAPHKEGLFAFIANNWRRVVLSGIPWACEGLGVYGIGVFLPILVMALGLEHFTPDMPEVLHVASSVRITLWISFIILPGFLLGLWLIQRKRSIIGIQTVGFLLCAASLVVLLLAYHYGWDKWIAIGAFMAFELFLNMGPHLITYVLPPHIYPVAVRGQGVGIAAAVGKIGAVLGVFVIPILLHSGGAVLVLIVSAAVMLIGALVTAFVKIK